MKDVREMKDVRQMKDIREMTAHGGVRTNA
jgi:hypothetical protein